MKKFEQVAIIGAGIAGLSAAQCLASRGIKVKVFEKARGPGGRSSTRRAHGFAFDHGAQYFTAQDPEFRAAVKRMEDDGVVGRWNPNRFCSTIHYVLL